MLEITTGCSIGAFLCGDLRLSSEYIRNTIGTVLLNGKPVDDIDAALLRNGSVLALSAAMPGLAGAAMRRGGLCSSLRSSITFKEDHDHCEVREGMITLKLFNVLLKELGPGILKKGIYVYSSALRDFLKDQTPGIWQDLSNLFINDNPVKVNLSQMDDWLNKTDRVLLTVRPSDCS